MDLLRFFPAWEQIKAWNTEFVGGIVVCTRDTGESIWRLSFPLWQLLSAEQVIWFLLSNRGCTGICSEHLPRVEALPVSCSSYWPPSPHDKGILMLSCFHREILRKALKILRNYYMLSLSNETVNCYLEQPRNKKGNVRGDEERTRFCVWPCTRHEGLLASLFPNSLIQC